MQLTKNPAPPLAAKRTCTSEGPNHQTTASAPERPILEVYMSADEPFVDRFTNEAANGIDVIIPVMHTNDLWRKNLLSIYREIPVKRLLLGDAGCIDQTLTIATEFPRVTVLDHREFVSLGYSLRKLIEEVRTDWFIYLHSDVYLPAGWFDTMCGYQGTYDWFECRQHLTVLLDFPLELPDWRSFSGSQMGRRAAFQKVLPKIDDDYLYRNEDIIIAKLVEEQGYTYGRVEDTCHYHQQMLKKSVWERKVRLIDCRVDRSRGEEVREMMMQAKGLVKYLDPSPQTIDPVVQCVNRLIQLNETTWDQFKAWVQETNPKWLLHLNSVRVKARNVLKETWGVGVAMCKWARSIAALGKSIVKATIPRIRK